MTAPVPSVRSAIRAMMRRQPELGMRVLSQITGISFFDIAAATIMDRDLPLRDVAKIAHAFGVTTAEFVALAESD